MEYYRIIRAKARRTIKPKNVSPGIHSYIKLTAKLVGKMRYGSTRGDSDNIASTIVLKML